MKGKDIPIQTKGSTNTEILILQNSYVLTEVHTLGEKDELTKFLREQITIENTIVDSLNNSLGEISNQAVRGVLKGISLDSVKHAEMYTAAVKLLTDVTPPLTQENLDTQIELVKNHIRLEAELIQKIGKILPNVENDKVSLLLNAILTDEKRHHALLTEVLQILVQGETITEEDWWNLIWKNVPFHGSPGG
jgi:rubrerythrin